MDKFNYLRSSVSFTENGINTWLAKIWSGYKSVLSDETKRIFFQAVVLSILQYGCITWTLVKRIEKKLDGNCTRMQQWYWTKPVCNIPQNKSCTVTDHPSLKPFKSNEQDMQGTAGELSDVHLWTLSHEQAGAGRPSRNYLQQLCSDTGCSLEDQPNAMDDRDESIGWVRKIHALSTTLYIYIYIYIYIYCKSVGCH